MANNPLADRWLSLVRLGALMNQRIEHALSERYDLCVSAYEIMEVLTADQEWLRPGEVSSRTSRSQPQVSRLLKQLVDAGYVTRKPSPGDARGSQIRLTPAGHEMFRAAAATVEDVLGQIVEEHPDARTLIA
ncbi:MarR family winged helix-turn-helix transcriptional regulator [Streptomyces sp. cmx-18-6]|uniref:MarR family winged helix-turn-helix transcriptional regulator n=1 Tax=Streptomyces sp. cmx-18-6 TaxID=2790930 RepID=UPI00397E9ADC